MFCEKGVLRNFAKFTGKHLWQSLFFIKKETLTQVFSFKFCGISKNTFFYKTAPVAACGSNENHQLLRCFNISNTWTLWHGHYDMDTMTWTLWHGHYDLDTMTWTLWHGHYDMDTMTASLNFWISFVLINHQLFINFRVWWNQFVSKGIDISESYMYEKFQKLAKILFLKVLVFLAPVKSRHFELFLKIVIINLVRPQNFPKNRG